MKKIFKWWLLLELASSSWVFLLHLCSNLFKILSQTDLSFSKCALLCLHSSLQKLIELYSVRQPDKNSWENTSYEDHLCESGVLDLSLWCQAYHLGLTLASRSKRSTELNSEAIVFWSVTFISSVVVGKLHNVSESQFSSPVKEERIRATQKDVTRIKLDNTDESSLIRKVMYLYDYNHLFITLPHFQHVASAWDDTGSSLPPQCWGFLLLSLSFCSALCLSSFHPSLKAQPWPFHVPKYLPPFLPTCIFPCYEPLLFSYASTQTKAQLLFPYFMRIEHLQVNLQFWVCRGQVTFSWDTPHST